MRNLQRYPVTRAEIIDCLLKVASEGRARQAPGDMRGLLLEEAAKIVRQSPDGDAYPPGWWNKAHAIDQWAQFGARHAWGLYKILAALLLPVVTGMSFLVLWMVANGRV